MLMSTKLRLDFSSLWKKFVKEDKKQKLFPQIEHKIMSQIQTNIYTLTYYFQYFKEKNYSIEMETKVLFCLSSSLLLGNY